MQEKQLSWRGIQEKRNPENLIYAPLFILSWPRSEPMPKRTPAVAGVQEDT